MNDPHSSSVPVAYLSALEMVRALELGEVTSLQVVDTLLERIGALDGDGTDVALRSIAALDPTARATAQERDDERARGVSRGPLHGVPVVIKDNIEALGLPGLAGSTALRGRPSRDAPLVSRLRDAGAIVLASTNLSQWANIRSPRSTSGYSASGGLVGNPWALDRSAGGSSSGSGAAVAAGFAPLAVGTETDGSIICPASVNGIVGLKPTVGVVPTTYVVPISASQDSPGPMARTVDDVALLYSVLAADRAPTTVRVPTMGVATNWRTGHPQTDTLFDEVLATLRSAGLVFSERELAIPGMNETNDEGTVMFAELLDDLGAYLDDRPGSGVRSLEEVIAYEDEHRDVEEVFFGHEYFITAVETGGRSGPVYADARRRNLAWALDTCLVPGLDGVDVVIAPAYGPSWKSDLVVGVHPGPASPVTQASAIAGWPIMCLPIGLIHGLPIGLGIIGRANSEWMIIEAARRIESVIREHDPLPRPLWRAPSRG